MTTRSDRLPRGARVRAVPEMSPEAQAEVFGPMTEVPLPDHVDATRQPCPRCLADRSDPSCCTPARRAQLVTVSHKPCGCTVEWDCGCVADGRGRHLQYGDVHDCIVCGSQHEQQQARAPRPAGKWSA